MPIPANPKIYHIVHVDKLQSILASQGLLCDAKVTSQPTLGTTIGMGDIKYRRLHELNLTCYPDLYVGQCVPFYFCPRSVMLFLIYRGNHPDLAYKGGQDPIVHLQFDLNLCVQWATHNRYRWAFTLSNAGSNYFEDRNDLLYLSDLNWNAIEARNWIDCKEGKQAEFLIEDCVPWCLVESIGVQNKLTYQKVANVINASKHRPQLLIKPDWYY